VKALAYTLVCDGTSDRCLTRIVDWLLWQLGWFASESQVADFRTYQRPPSDLRERVREACLEWPCDLLVVHRDAERARRETRVNEITAALSSLQTPPAVAVVPVRMTEAWLLFDEHAIRLAAGNPAGRGRLPLPRRSPEAEPNPKRILQNCLKAASGKQGRRLQRFERDLSELVIRVADCVDDFSPLRSLSAFGAFEADLRHTLTVL
jgi:hypothetical protein